MARRRTATILSKLELEVMRRVWEEEPVTVRQVMEGLNAGRRRKLAYNTVQTMFRILKEKGVLRSIPGPGRAHLFRSRLSREAASAAMVRDMAERLYDGALAPMLLHLVESESIDDGELQRLRGWIEDHLSDREGGP